VGTGTTTSLVATLSSAGLIAERPAAPSGARGRPTTELVPHPGGPLVVAVDIAHEQWRADVVQIGGAVLDTTYGARTGPEETLTAVAAALQRFRRRLPGRIRGVGIAVPGTVLAGRTVDASYLGWRQVDLRRLWPRAPLLVAGNDATLAALAEVRRGVAVDGGVVLHLQIEAGLGGALVDHGRVLGGARDTAGEFGHLPFGDPAVRCPCGAYGCWGNAIDGSALARLLGARTPRDPVSYGRRVLARAERGSAAELAAVRLVGGELGRGTAGLVNALDPDTVVLAGLGVPLLAAAGPQVLACYQRGLMAFRRAAPPPLRTAVLGIDGARIGAAEEAWSKVWPSLTV